MDLNKRIFFNNKNNNKKNNKNSKKINRILNRMQLNYKINHKQQLKLKKMKKFNLIKLKNFLIGFLTSKFISIHKLDKLGKKDQKRKKIYLFLLKKSNNYNNYIFITTIKSNNQQLQIKCKQIQIKCQLIIKGFQATFKTQL